MTQTPTPRPLALVTGASGGIGEEIARELAARGFDLVLVARTLSKLESLGEVLRVQHGVTAHSIALDLSDPAAPAHLEAEVQRRGLVVDVLVNNAGFASYGEFWQLDLDHEMRMLQVNVTTLVELTRRLLPGMVERGRGRVLNVASTAAFMPGPLMAVYYATKAFVLSFSEAIAEELRGTGVTVTTLAPGPTESGFQARAGMEDSKLVKGRAIMDSATVARLGVDALLRGQRVIIPGRANQLQALSPRFLPRALVPGIVKSAQAHSH
ncbi:short-chain dehydrogenase (plasmid) [Deinococcus aetherius]|uniref:Short-chain dehydrogenase n=1 Tax=Deinococcus aetherius TaxID=200252 RepID=A0ABM8AJ38_9DEIO|nr:SDR family oxidoreductase [Deinococcus aetherius]BDP43819.1 short-chain dehydrogenase [Deinococcus aetherius]